MFYIFVEIFFFLCELSRKICRKRFKIVSTPNCRFSFVVKIVVRDFRDFELHFITQFVNESKQLQIFFFHIFFPLMRYVNNIRIFKFDLNYKEKI